MFKKITIIGDGAMGTVCAMLLASKGLSVTMWGYDREQLNEIRDKKENVKFLPGYKLSEKVDFVADDSKAMVGAELLVSAVPCQFTRSIWERLKPYVPTEVPIISVTKGIENSTLETPTQIIYEALGDDRIYGTLSGPTIADELARHLPATACTASNDAEFTREAQETFSTPYFRVYSNDDIIGVELAGAMKNVIAIAAGIVDGMGLGDNAKAALLARGLAEITRLGLAMGAKAPTFAGLTGLGDLVTTCVSPVGRNRTFGERIGKGMTAKDALGATHSVVEGAATCRSVVELAKKHGVEIPISEAIYNVVTDKISVYEAIKELMARDLKSESI